MFPWPALPCCPYLLHLFATVVSFVLLPCLLPLACLPACTLPFIYFTHTFLVRNGIREVEGDGGGGEGAGGRRKNTATCTLHDVPLSLTPFLLYLIFLIIITSSNLIISLINKYTLHTYNMPYLHLPIYCIISHCVVLLPACLQAAFICLHFAFCTLPHPFVCLLQHFHLPCHLIPKAFICALPRLFGGFPYLATFACFGTG